MSDESLELAQVQAAFREAERKFQALATAAQDLQTATGQLNDARSAVADAGERLGDLAEASRSVTEQLADATRAIEATDPAEIRSQLRGLAESLDTHAQQTEELVSTLVQTQQSIEAARQRSLRLQMILGVLTLIAVVAVGVLVLLR